MFGKVIIKMAIISLLAILALGCDDESSSSGKFELSTIVAAEVDVSLNGDIGTIVFIEDSAMPQNDELEMKALLGNEINLVVTNLDTGITAELTDGRQVDTIPGGADEYRVTIVDGAVNITFFNLTALGQVLRTAGSYHARVIVNFNDYFVAEDFERAISVQ